MLSTRTFSIKSFIDVKYKEGTSLEQGERMDIHSKEWCRHILRLEPTFDSWRIQLLPAPREEDAVG